MAQMDFRWEVLPAIVIISALFVCSTFAQSSGEDNNNDNCPSELDAADFSDLRIYRVADFNKNEASVDLGVRLDIKVSESKVKTWQTDGDTAAGPELQDYIRQSSTKPPVDTQGSAVAPCAPVCPIKWVMLPRTKYYISEPVKPGPKLGQVIFTYLFPYADIWIADCPVLYCTVRYDRSNPWDYRYRCVKEYRIVWTWVVKMKIDQDMSGEVTKSVIALTKVFLPLRLPRNCACKRYAPWLLESDRCPRSNE